MQDLKDIALNYFAAHPAEKRRVIDIGLKDVPETGEYVAAVVIRAEEERYFSLLERAKKLVKGLKPEDITGKNILKLQCLSIYTSKHNFGVLIVGSICIGRGRPTLLHL